jgi:nicotinate-nucleotide adenylyltransferase
VLAEQCREQCELDEVWFVPASLPPHKQTTMISSPKVRCEMIQLAIAGNPAFRLNSIELNRQGPSFTVETLSQLHAEDSNCERFLLIGADSLKDLHLWREPSRILELSTVVAVNRGDCPPPELDALREICGAIVESRILHVQMPAIAISATDIRARIHSGRSIRYLVPRAVETYIHEHGLYRSINS